MKRKVIWSVAVVTSIIVLLLLLWIGIVVFRTPSYLKPDTSDWQTGDIFFSVGDSWKSVAVRSLTGARDFNVSDSTPSHCGVVVVESGVVKLVHASTSAQKIVKETPDEYLEKNGSYCLFIRKSPAGLDSVGLKQDADSLVANSVPFDFDFDHSESKSLYCTEMVVHLYELNGCPNFSALRKKGHIYPNDLQKHLNSNP